MTGFDKAGKTLEKLWPGLQQGDAKAIHEARKLTRKVQAQLRIAGAPKRTKRAWRDLRQAVAPIRDRDATGQHLRDALQALQVPEAEIRAFEEQWANARQRTFDDVRFPEVPPGVERPKRWKDRAREAVQSDAVELLREGTCVLSSADPEPWHTWRKHLKRYRYTMELLQEPPRALLDVLEALGRLQDAQVVQDLLLREGWLAAHRDALLAREAEAEEAARKRVRERWPALAEHFISEASRELQER